MKSSVVAAFWPIVYSVVTEPVYSLESVTVTVTVTLEPLFIKSGAPVYSTLYFPVF